MSQMIDVILAPPWPAERMRDAHVAIVDVLRATSSIATALAHGAEAVIAVEDPEEALTIANRLGRERVVLCGERDSVKIPGFELDNSPASFSAAAVRAKTLVMTTTNGTRAIHAVTGAASVRTASLLNRAAVADALAAQRGDLIVVCAGDQGRFALDDALAAGALVDALLARIPGADLRDGARAAVLLYRGVAGSLAAAIASSDHAGVLARKGFGGDVWRCAQLDALDVVPTLRDGMLIAG